MLSYNKTIIKFQNRPIKYKKNIYYIKENIIKFMNVYLKIYIYIYLVCRLEIYNVLIKNEGFKHIIFFYNIYFNL